MAWTGRVGELERGDAVLVDVWEGEGAVLAGRYATAGLDSALPAVLRSQCYAYMGCRGANRSIPYTRSIQ